MDLTLREQLTQMTDIVDVTEHPARGEGLRAKFGHTIALVEEPAAIERYTCAVYAFDLVEDPTYGEIATSFGPSYAFAGCEFVEYVLNTGLLSERPLDVRAPGDLLIYSDKGRFRHIGKLREVDRVVSKWGVGYLWEHGLWEVPSKYGNDVRFFEALADGDGLDLFINFAES